MVAVKSYSAADWSTNEKIYLFEVYQSEIDWPTRAGKIAQKFGKNRNRGFFSPSACQAEFERIKSLPVPGHDVAVSAKPKFSHKTVIDAWISHLKNIKDDEEYQRKELELVEMRRYSDLIQGILYGNWRRMDPNQIRTHLAELRAEDAERENQDQVCRVVNAYMGKLFECIDRPLQEPKLKTTIPATRQLSTAPRGADTAFRSPSPSSSGTSAKSPMSSPVRRVADSIREATLLRMPSSAVVDKEEPIDASVSTGSIDWDFDDDGMSSMGTIYKVDIEPKRPRGRPKSTTIKDTREKNSPRPEVPDTKEIKQESTDDAQVRRPPRRPAPENAGATKVKRPRSAIGAGEEHDDIKYKSKLEVLTVESPATPSPVSGTHAISVQTEISIRGTLWIHQEKKEKRVQAARKTKRNDNIGTFEQKKTVGTQTVSIGSLDLSDIDQVLVGWCSEDPEIIAPVAPTFQAITTELQIQSEEISSRNVSSEHVPVNSKEIDLVLEVENWVAEGAVKYHGYYFDEGLTATPSSAAKRGRKDSQRDESALKMKSMLLSAWNVVSGHRHSGIFSHPVQDRDAPNYSKTVARRMDLHTLKREIENGTITNIATFKHRVLLMFANAVMYNSTGHDINLYAKEMAHETIFELEKFVRQTSRPIQLLLRRHTPGVNLKIRCSRKRNTSVRKPNETSESRKLFSKRFTRRLTSI